MQAAVPPGVGAMAALKLDGLLELDEVRETIIACEVEIANYNCDSQVVISGRGDGIESARERLARELPELEFVALPVSAPFHSMLMRPIESAFGVYLEQFDCNAAAAGRVLSNFTGRPHPEDRDALFENLTRQISGAVRWIENMQFLHTRCPGAGEIFEICPGRPLGGFFLRQGFAPPPSIVTVRCLQKAAKNNSARVAV